MAMYELRRTNNTIIKNILDGEPIKSENLQHVKDIAEKLKTETSYDYEIFKVVQVWTTKKLG